MVSSPLLNVSYIYVSVTTESNVIGVFDLFDTSDVIENNVVPVPSVAAVDDIVTDSLLAIW